MFNAKELSPEQRTQIENWAKEGAQLDDIQKKLKESESLNLTYMETRFLILDLGIELVSEEVPEEPAEEAVPEPAQPVEPAETLSQSPPPSDVPPTSTPAIPAIPAGELAAGVELHVDQVAIPNTMVSGSVTFNNGEKAHWYVDTEGRLGMETVSETFTPTEDDLGSFQKELRKALEQM